MHDRGDRGHHATTIITDGRGILEANADKRVERHQSTRAGTTSLYNMIYVRVFQHRRNDDLPSFVPVASRCGCHQVKGHFRHVGTNLRGIRSLAGETATRKTKMKRLGTAALALGVTLAIATGAFAQTGRDAPQTGTSMDSQKSGSMSQKGGTMQNNSMQKGTMQKGSSGTMSK